MTKSINRLFAFLRRQTPTPQHVAPAAAKAPRRDFVIPLKALAPSTHLDRMSTIVRMSFARVEAVNSAHDLARQQLDVADYTLQNIMDELRTIMPSQFPGTLKLAPIHATPAYSASHARQAA